MIAKLTTGNGFGGALKYDAKSGLEESSLVKVLGGCGVYVERDKDGHPLDLKGVGLEFRLQAMLRPSVRKPLYHWALSWQDGENISDKEMLSASCEFLKKMGFVDTQYLIIRHPVTAEVENPHCHILVNIVNNKGERISTRGMIDKCHRVSAEITKARGYAWGENADKKQSLVESAHKPHERARYYVRPIIKDCLEKATSFEEMYRLLKEQGIGMLYGERDDKKAHLSFLVKFEGQQHTFSASSVAKYLSYRNMERRLEYNRQELITEKATEQLNGWKNSEAIYFEAAQFLTFWARELHLCKKTTILSIESRYEEFLKNIYAAFDQNKANVANEILALKQFHAGMETNILNLIRDRLVEDFNKNHGYNVWAAGEFLKKFDELTNKNAVINKNSKAIRDVRFILSRVKNIDELYNQGYERYVAQGKQLNDTVSDKFRHSQEEVWSNGYNCIHRLKDNSVLFREKNEDGYWYDTKCYRNLIQITPGNNPIFFADGKIVNGRGFEVPENSLRYGLNCNEEMINLVKNSMKIYNTAKSIEKEVIPEVKKVLFTVWTNMTKSYPSSPAPVCCGCAAGLSDSDIERKMAEEMGITEDQARMMRRGI